MVVLWYYFILVLTRVPRQLRVGLAQDFHSYTLEVGQLTAQSKQSDCGKKKLGRTS